MRHLIWVLPIICVVGAISYLVINKPDRLPVAPDVHMMTECDSFVTAVHVFNPDDRAITYSYRLYVDINNNSLLDSSDVFVSSGPRKIVGPKDEDEGMKLRPAEKYKPYSFIVQVKTDELITYYASIPCNEGSK